MSALYSSNLLLVVIAAVIVLVVKTLISGFVAFLLGFPFRTTVLAGLALSQVGEFSFILARSGMDFDLIDDTFYRLFIAVSVMTMALAPFIIMMAPRLAGLLGRLPLPVWLERGLNPPVYDTILPMNNHLVIIGHGLHGKNVARAAKMAGVSYLIIDNDPDLVREEKEKGENIYFGDAAQEPVLHQAGIGVAEVVVITPSNSATVYSLTEQVRKLNPKAHILVRARQTEDIDDLYRLGASEVIPEEFETSVEIFARVMAKFLIPHEDIERFISDIRSDSYSIFRRPGLETNTVRDLGFRFPDLEISAIKVHPSSMVSGKSIAEAKLRTIYGITLVAVTRDGKSTQNPDPGLTLQPGDVVYVMGTHDQVRSITTVLHETAGPPGER